MITCGLVTVTVRMKETGPGLIRRHHHTQTGTKLRQITAVFLVPSFHRPAVLGAMSRARKNTIIFVRNVSSIRMRI